MEVNSQPPKPSINLLTARECSELVRLDERTLRRLRKAGRFPEPIRFGRALRWKSSTVANWLESLVSKASAKDAP